MGLGEVEDGWGIRGVEWVKGEVVVSMDLTRLDGMARRAINKGGYVIPSTRNGSNRSRCRFRLNL